MTTVAYASFLRQKKTCYIVARHPVNHATRLLPPSMFLYGMCSMPCLGKAVTALGRWDRTVATRGPVSLFWRSRPLTCSAFSRPVQDASRPPPLPGISPSSMPSTTFQPSKSKPSGEWDFAFASLRSSSYLSMGPVMSWFTGYIGEYHHVHHANAQHSVPALAARSDGRDRELQSPGRYDVLHLMGKSQCGACGSSYGFAKRTAW